MDGAGEFSEVGDRVGEEKTVSFDKFSLQSESVCFFAFSESISDCDMAANVVGFVWVDTDVVMCKGGSGMASVWELVLTE